MAPQVGGPQTRRLYPSVDLRGRDACMPEQLLDDAEVGAAFEQMGRERMPERVRMEIPNAGDLRRGLLRPHPQAATNVRGAQTASRLRQEERSVLAVGERRSRTGQVALDRPQGMFARGHEARLFPLALNAHLLGVEVDGVEIERDE